MATSSKFLLNASFGSFTNGALAGQGGWIDWVGDPTNTLLVQNGYIKPNAANDYGIAVNKTFLANVKPGSEDFELSYFINWQAIPFNHTATNVNIYLSPDTDALSSSINFLNGFDNDATWPAMDDSSGGTAFAGAGNDQNHQGPVGEYTYPAPISGLSRVSTVSTYIINGSPALNAFQTGTITQTGGINYSLASTGTGSQLLIQIADTAAAYIRLGYISYATGTATITKSGNDAVLTWTRPNTDHFKISQDGGAYGANVTSPQTITNGATSSFSIQAYNAANASLGITSGLSIPQVRAVGSSATNLLLNLV